jgi:hypothetical protein
MVRLHGVEVRDGGFHAWIERDDARPLGRVGDVQAWRFPSYFTTRSHVHGSSVNSLACGDRVISVGNCEEAAERMHRSSSHGPTRWPAQARDRRAGHRYRRSARFRLAGPPLGGDDGDEYGQPAGGGGCRPDARARAAAHGRADRGHHASHGSAHGFASIIQSIEQGFGSGSNLTRKFFGLNAARYFGLTRGSANRRRLERFYDDNDMREPLWMTKVDAA